MIREHLSVLEKLQLTNESLEIWWDSPPADFPGWRDDLLARAPDAATRQRWSAQFDRFLVPHAPERSLVRGVTTNPSLVANSILRSPVWWGREIHRQATQQRVFDPESLFSLVCQEVITSSANAMMPLWQHSDGQHGWVSAQLDPRHMFDVARMTDQALQLARLGPNVMIKVPGTFEGYQVIRKLVARGISINNTMTYTVAQFLECARAVEEGLAIARRTGNGNIRWRAVVTDMIGRYGGQGDLVRDAAEHGVELEPLDVRWAEIAVVKRIDQIFRARPSPVKMLLSSLETEDPDAPTGMVSMHLQQTAGANIVYTCKPRFVEAIMRRELELVDFDPAAIDEPVPTAVHDRLARVPYFRQAIQPDGMSPERFAEHSAFVATHAEVNRNTARLLEFIEHRIAELPIRH